MNRSIPRRAVLIIVYPFPPMGGSGVQRTVKFVKYLSQFGWRPVVLTVKNPPLGEADRSLLDELPDSVEIHRSWSVEPRRPSSSRNRLAAVDRSGRGAGPKFSEQRNALERLSAKVKRFINTWIFIPDREIGWFPSALIRGLKIMRESEIDIIYSTSDPFTDHLIGFCLKRLSNKPWVADFRDPWSGYTLHKSPSRFRQKLDVRLEGRFLKAADRIIVTCQSAVGAFLEAHGEIEEAKFVEITNGFDPADFPASLNGDKRDGSFTIVYVGRFWDQKNYSPAFLLAVKELLEENAELKKGMRVIFVGDFGEKAAQCIARWGLQKDIEIVGYRPHRESVGYLRRADVLLLTVNNIPGAENIYPGKMFEYLAAQKPILALATEGAAAGLIREMQAGVVVQPDDVEAIKEAIYALYTKGINNRLELKHQPSLDRFERVNLTRSLARCLDELAR